ncbi:MAG TPA: outer membrane protein transport protein [Thermoanaerobaculia bacterium]|nr:outer membrane protein transport protein [Thermoanaerobaculia bacterium]
MRPINFRLRLSVVSLLALLPASIALGSGFSIFEQGAKATGMGGAFAATADDPSAIFYNVAGIAYQRKVAAMVGGTIINFENQFEGAGDDALTSGRREFFARHTFIPPNAYAVIPIGDNVTVGVGSFGAFGLRTNWDNENRYSGRFISQDANLKVVSVEPAIAWKSPSGRFALGLGAEYRRSHISLERNIPAINPFTNRIVDIAHVRLDSDWSDAWGFNVGAIFKLNETCQIGLSHRSEMTIDYTGDAKFTQILTGNAQLDSIIRSSRLPPDQDINTSIDYPSLTHLGFATTAVPNWQIEFDTVWATWSNFKQLSVNFETTPVNSFVTPQNWEDTFSYRLGGNRHVTENADIRLGVLYDENPQPVEGVGPLLPDSDRIGFSFGIGYRRGPFTIEASDLILHFFDRDTLGRNRDNYNGTYKTSANLLSINLGYTF